MKPRTVRNILAAVIISLLGCLLIGCGGSAPKPPEVKDVVIKAADGNSYGKVGALHKIEYTVADGCEIATSVQIGDSFATAADYAYSDGGYIFYTAGEYTVTVYAAKGGMLGHASAKITVRGGEASVSDVNISAASGEVYGRVGALHVLSYTTDEDCSINVTFTNGCITSPDVIFNKEYNTVIFGSAGQYTVTVTATLGEAADSAATQIDVSAAAAPEITLTTDKSSVREDETVTLNHTAVYEGGDFCEYKSVRALYRTSNSGEFREADTEMFTVLGNRFTPHVAGEWKIIYSEHGKGGAEGEADATVKCEPTQITLTNKSSARRRIQTNKAADVNYSVTGAADKYNVTFDTHGHGGVTAVSGDGCSVRVTAAEVDYFTVTVIYTHKVVSSIQQKIDIDFYSVDSLTYAPEWGEDPFDGMPTDVLTSMGHLLYFNASACGGEKREFSAQNVKYEVIEHNVTAASGSNAVEILYAADDGRYPYVIVSNYDNNVAEGDFTLKMTLTDSYTGYSAVATKKFNVLPTGNNNASAAAFIQNYIERHSEFFDMGSMDFSNVSSNCRHNMVLTKTGTVMQRSNPGWPLKDDNGSDNADFARMDYQAASDNCRLEFKFGLLAPNPTTGEVWLGIGMRTVNFNGWAGFFDLHAVNGKLAITNGLGEMSGEYLSPDAAMPDADGSATLFVRIDRRVSGDTAEYTVYVKTEEDAPYKQYYRCTLPASAKSGSAGAPVALYQFTHRNGGGCYAVENVRISSFSA